MNKAQELGALAMVAVALVVVAGLAWQGNEQAQGALIGVIAAGVSFYLRGRIQAA